MFFVIKFTIKLELYCRFILKIGKFCRMLYSGKMSREHHDFFEKIFSNLQIWKIMGAAMGEPNVLHHKQLLYIHNRLLIDNKKKIAAQASKLSD